jgi:chaperonin GroES
MQEGEVIAVGPGGRNETGKLTAHRREGQGTRVLFGKWSGTEIKIGGDRSAHHEGI